MRARTILAHEPLSRRDAARLRPHGRGFRPLSLPLIEPVTAALLAHLPALPTTLASSTSHVERGSRD